MRMSGIFCLALVAGCAAAIEAPPVPAQAAPPVVAPPAVALPPIAPSVAAEPPPVEANDEAAAAPAPTLTRTPKAAAKTVHEEPPATKKAEPTLDVASLKARLRSTKAIGVLTKLTLENQMNDLVKLFRAYYAGGSGVASLRQPYDALVLKVLSVLQDGDPSLARSISESREALWNILSDPEKFNALI